MDVSRLGQALNYVRVSKCVAGVQGCVYTVMELETVHLVSDVQGPARLESPGSGSALEGSGLPKRQAGPWMRARARLGLGSGLGRGLIEMRQQVD